MEIDNKSYIRKLIKSVINEEINNKNITEIIKQVSSEYTEENQCTLWDINNGLCEDFAQEVIQRMGGYIKDNLYELTGDMFFAVLDPEFAKENWNDTIETEYGVWGKDMLDHWGWPHGININKVEDGLNHTWIYYNGKHYDAEAPQGVNKWYDLPLNKKFFDEWRENTTKKHEPYAIYQYINKMHKAGWENKKFDDKEWVMQHEYFILKDVAIDDPTVKWNFGQHPPVVKDYSKLSTEIPPIVIASNRYIIDGTHRAGASKEKGNKTIKAFVGF